MIVPLITPAMIDAGLSVFYQWDAEYLDGEQSIVAIYTAMENARLCEVHGVDEICENGVVGR